MHNEKQRVKTSDSNELVGKMLADEFIVRVNEDSLSLNEIIGQDEAVSALKELANQIKFGDIFRLWKVPVPKGILLTGGPGTGKTAAVRAFAKDAQDSIVLMELKYTDIASKWVDAPIEKLNKFFRFAEEISEKKHVVVFIDEIDAMLPDRSDQIHETSNRRVNVFLEWMDGGMRTLKNVTLIGATNHIEKMDLAALRPGRFDRAIEFKDMAGRDIVECLKIHLSRLNLNKDQLSRISWGKIEKAVSGLRYTGAELSDVISRVISQKANQHLNIITHNAMKDNILTKINENYWIARSSSPKPICTKDILAQLVCPAETDTQFNYPRPQIGFQLSKAS